MITPSPSAEKASQAWARNHLPKPTDFQISQMAIQFQRCIDDALAATQAKLEQAQTDSARLDWMQRMADECEGHILTRCFLPDSRPLRSKIKEMMEVNP